MPEHSRPSQCERIIEYMKTEGSITQIDALREFGCMRLASRVSELRKAGVPIVKTLEKSKNRYGESISYARYSLEEENANN